MKRKRAFQHSIGKKRRKINKYSYLNLTHKTFSKQYENVNDEKLAQEADKGKERERKDENVEDNMVYYSNIPRDFGCNKES